MAGLLDFGGAAPSGGGGLLDFITSDPGARMGLTMLAASSPKFGGGILQALQSQEEMKKNALQQQYIQSQIAENTSQNKVREMQMKAAMDKQAWEQAYYMGGQMPNQQGAGYIAPSGAGTATSPGAPSAFSAAGGATTMPSGGKFDEWSQKYNIPKDALISDWKNNGGKGIADMLLKRGAPDMQVTNGYAYDKNSLSAGYLPQLNISNDGKATQVRIGPDGQPVVSAPRGAPETFGTYQGIQAGIQSANTPLKVFNPNTQREEFLPQSSVLRGASAQPQYSGAGYAGGSAAAAAPEQLQIMQAELNKLPPNHPDRPAIMREMQRLGGGQMGQSGNYAAGPSALETAANEALRAKSVDTAKADAARESDTRGKIDQFKILNRQIDKAQTLLEQGPTGSGTGALVDSALGMVGVSTKGAELASALKATAGWMRQNVPKAPGAQSDAELRDYSQAIGDVGNERLPIQTRLAALKAAKDISTVWEERSAGGSKLPGQTGTNGATGSWGDKPIPQGAINDLKMRGPKAKAQFDEVFGPGAADRVLGGR